MFERLFGKNEPTTKYPDVTLAKIETVWNRLGGNEGVERFLSGKLKVVSKWREDNGVIYLSLPLINEGKPIDEWIKTRGDKKVDNFCKKVEVWDRGNYSAYDSLRTNYKPQVSIAQIAILRASLFKKGELTDENIRAEGIKRGLIEPDPGVMLSLAEVMSPADFGEMGIEEIIGMHKRLPNSPRCDAGLLKLYAPGTMMILSIWEAEEFPTEWGFVFQLPGDDWYGIYE